MFPQALLNSRNIASVDQLYNELNTASGQLAADYAAAVYPVSMQRVGLDQIISDGATSLRAQIQMPGARGNLAGVAAATWRGIVTWPTANPVGGGSIVASLTPATGTAFQVNALSILLTTSGGIRLRCFGAATTDFRYFDHPTFRAVYSGQTGILEVYFVTGATNPVVRWNDIDVSAGFSVSTGGAGCNWLAASLVSTYHQTGTEWPAGPAPVGCWIVGALAAADRTYWRATGKPPAWVAMGGNASTATLGALSLPLIQRGGVIGDATHIADNPARLVGMRAITEKKDFQWTATIDTASTGNKQLLGGAVFTDPLQIALDSIDRNGTGAETASVGDGTTAAKYSASSAKTAIRNRLALADHYPADAAKTGLYYDVTVAGAALTTAKLTVRGHVIP